MFKRIFTLIISIISMSLPMSAFAEGSGSSGGLSLVTDGSARLASVGGAATAIEDDATAAMGYNPAMLSTLKSGHASFLYQAGLIEDAYGMFTLGLPRGEKSGLGASVSYYNGGDIELFNPDGTTSSVNAQTDITGAVGYAHNFGNASVGVSGKFLHSKLIDQVSASAYALDLGAQMAVTDRVRIGAAALNYGSQLKYVEAGDNLPRMLRGGTSILLLPGRTNTTLFLDAAYWQNEKMLNSSIGLETLVGPLAVRAGYRNSADSKELTFGAGFAFGRSNLDYAFGMVNQLDAQHKVSLGMRFGGARMNNTFVRKPQIKKERAVEERSYASENRTPTETEVARDAEPVVEATERRHTIEGTTTLRVPQKKMRRVYIVKQGDTLAKISQKVYGTKTKWKQVYSANKHLIDSPESLEKGMRILIP